MDIECYTKNVALKTENETQNREQWRHVFSDKVYRGFENLPNVDLEYPAIQTQGKVFPVESTVSSQFDYVMWMGFFSIVNH